jgi:arylsulfatase A-like enzyme
VTNGNPIGLTDLTATVLDIAGAEPSPNVFGRSLLPVFDGNAVGSGLTVSEILDFTMIFDGQWKLVVNSRGEVLMLFDTASDPAESVNLAGRSDTAGTIERLRVELLDFHLRTADRQFREVNG